MYGLILALNIAVICCLVRVAWVDYKTMEIPDSMNIAIAVCGILAIFFGADIGPREHLLGIIVAAPLFIISFFITDSFGFGDVKLMAASGFFLGFQSALVALFIGVVIGGVYGSYLLLTRKKSGKEHFALGPALCAGIGIAAFAGDKIVDWYFGFL